MLNLSFLLLENGLDTKYEENRDPGSPLLTVTVACRQSPRDDVVQKGGF